MAACEVASVNPDAVTAELLMAAADRMRDKKVSSGAFWVFQWISQVAGRSQELLQLN